MKAKSILTSLLFILFIGGIRAQIPNPGFEDLNYCSLPNNWGYQVLQVIQIDSIGNQYTDSLIYDSVPFFTYASPDAHSGNYSLCIRNAYNYSANEMINGQSDLFSDTSSCSGFFCSVMPINYTPEGVNFFFKYTPVGNDTAFFQSLLLDSNGVEIANATYYFTEPQTTFTEIQVPFSYSYNVTAAYYTMKFSNVVADFNMHQSHLGTRLYIDDISFAGLNAVENEKQSSVSIYPNPTANQFRINSSMEVESVRILDMNGSTVKIFTTNEQVYDISNLPVGVYMLEVIHPSTKHYTKIIKAGN